MPISINLFSIKRVTLASPPTQPPYCPCCSRVSKRLITRSSNRNGNAGRPYSKCLHCDKFLVFDDYRGNDSTNPECHCGYSSKRQVSGRSKPVAGRLHYVCRLGMCDFFSPGKDAKGIDVIIDMDLTEDLSRLSIIWYDSFIAS
ncbi:hypothetical protein RRF57_012800 [Xylaria bambusicola]|uniref:GRF-like zinc ribbon domain-containing protein n=1 Tax=Xylaria bambusicola TaxID=326684 RepID=A0AAN7ZF10_9PEZI